jgi:hypothetical protein
MLQKLTFSIFSRVQAFLRYWSKPFEKLTSSLKDILKFLEDNAIKS